MCLKCNSNRNENRISGLPNKLLLHILSFLNTIEAIRTGVLSHRWEKLWMSVPTLDLEDRSYGYQAEDYNPNGFCQIVDHVLSKRGSIPIQKFSLKGSHPDGYPHFQDWMGAPISNVVELNLLTHGSYARHDPYELPISIFSLKSLVTLSLNLEKKYVFILPNSNCFPCLKLLDVNVFGPYPATMASLFTCGPVLEHLIISGQLDDKQPMTINISAPELKTLELSIGYIKFPRLYRPLIPNYTFNINAPKLERFGLDECCLAMYYVNANRSPQGKPALLSMNWIHLRKQ